MLQISEGFERRLKNKKEEDYSSFSLDISCNNLQVYNAVISLGHVLQGSTLSFVYVHILFLFKLFKIFFVLLF